MNKLNWAEIEKNVKDKLEREYNKKFLKRKKIIIGNYHREIDLLSEDGEIAVQVKSGRDLTTSKRIKDYRFAEICVDYLILMATKSSKKLLVLTDKEMFEQFSKEKEGLPLHGVEVLLVEC